MTTSSTRNASGKSKNKNRILSRFMMTSALVAVGTFGFIPFADAADIELPVFGSLAGGNAIVTTNPALDKMNIDQVTDRVIINWNTFNIGADATVRFDQPNSGSLAVNKVTDSVTFTRIDGKLKANGKVVILDPNGIIFGAGSVTDVGAIVASTGNVDNTAVMAGGLMQLTNFGTGKIVNKGEINAADSGLVAFVGSTVKNSGVIRANLGRVSLAAGNETATVDLYGDGLVELSYTNKNEDLLSENTGKIKAIGGTIQMTAAQAKDTVDSVVNMKGIAKANSAIVTNGKIILSAGKKVKVGSGAKVKGNTTITSKTVDLDSTIDGTVTGSATKVNILSDSAKIAQGLNVVDANGTVNVAAGTYNEHLVIDKSGVTLRGANAGIAGSGIRGAETIINPNSPGVTIVADNVTVNGLLFAGATGLDGYGIFVDNADNATLKNNVIDNVSQYGVYLLNSLGSVVNNNAINNTGNHGIYALNSANTEILKNNIGTIGTNNNINGDGVLLERSNGSVVKGNTITETTSTASQIGSGIHVKSSNNVLISDNTIYGNEWDGIKITRGANVSVSGNNISDVTRTAIYAEDTKDLSVLLNTINNAKLWGIQAIRINGANISDNIISNTVRDGINIGNSNSGLKTVSNNTIDKTSLNGIHVFASNGTIIDGNKVGLLGGVDNIKTNGIFVTNSSDVSVLENEISNSKQNGVYLLDSLGSVVNNNAINNTGSYGIYALNSANTSISRNRVGALGGNNNIKGDNILIDKSNGTTISENTLTESASTAFDIGSGVHIKNSDDTTISNNTIYGNEWDGIKITRGANVSVTGNNINDVVRTAVYAWGTRDVSVLGNTIDNAKLWGIQTIQINGANISDNFISNTVRDGINIGNSNSGLKTVSNNTIDKTGLNGIYVFASNNTIIDGNKVGLLGGVDNIKANGIFVTNSSDISVLENEISNSKQNGVHAIDVSGLVTINGNTINNSGNDGILVDGYAPGTIFIISKSKNTVIPQLELPALNGLYVNGNTITDSGNNGISILNPTGYVEVIGNTITNSGNDGIYVSNYSPSYIDYAPVFALRDSETEGEIVDYTPVFENGLYINDNVITNSGTETSSESEYAKSYLAEGDGIDVNNASGYVEISGNDINNSAQNGIYVHGYNNQMYSRVSESEMYISIPIWESNLKLLIDNNFVNESGFNGVYLSNLEGDLTVSNNEIYNSGNNGVSTEYVNQYGAIYGPYDVMSAKKELFVTDYPASYLTQLIITGNDIDNSEYDGVNLYQTGGYVSVDNNTITDSGENGIYVYNSSLYYDGFDGGGEMMKSQFIMDYPSGYNNPIELHIVDNTVENVGFVPNQDGESVVAEVAPNGFAAINLDITGDGYAEISGNTMGNNFEYGIFARSGEIDLTGATNTIQNTAIGMGFYPAPKGAPDEDSEGYFDFLASQLKLTNDTIGTTAFVDQADFFVDLGYGAFFAPGTPTILNGNDATYTLGGATIAPSVYGGVTQAEYDVLEARFNHFVDFQNRGLFFFNILPDLLTFDQEDVFRTFNFPTEFGQGGSLIVTGLPRIAGVAAPVAGGFNPNAIEPAAGDDGTTGGDAAAAGIEPAAGGATNSACWADATQALGQGTPISFNFGGGSSALLQDAANCGSGTSDQNL